VNEYDSIDPDGPPAEGQPPNQAPVSLSYDAAGNLTLDPLACNAGQTCGTGVAPVGSGQWYKYDEENRVVRVRQYNGVLDPNDPNDPNGPLLAEYEYDALGRRVHSIEYIDPSTGEALATPKKTRHVYVGIETMEEYQISGPWYEETATLSREFLWGDPSSFPEPIALVTHDGASSSTYHYIHDVLGSVVALTDSAGVVVERYTYDPYGKTLIERLTANGYQPTASSAFGNPWAWTGQRYDAETGLYAFFYRAYSPSLGRWLQRDPIGYVGTPLSLYLYGLANPLRWIDPLGLQPTTQPAPQPGSQPASQPGSQPTSVPSDEVEVPPSLREGFDEAWKRTEVVDENTREKHEHGGVIVLDDKGNPRVGTIVKGEPGSIPGSAFRRQDGQVGDYHTHPGDSDLPPSHPDMHRSLKPGKTYFVVTGNCTYAIRVVDSAKAVACLTKGSEYTGKIWADAVKACANRGKNSGKSTSQCSSENETNKCIQEGNCAVAKACGLKLYAGCGDKKNKLSPVACP